MSSKNRIDKASSALKSKVSKMKSLDGSSRLRINSTQQGPTGKSNKKK